MLAGIKKIHLIGICGTGMRAIANVLIAKGFEVTGSDVNESLMSKKFRALGAKINIGHRADAIHGADAVVISTAIPENNEELEEARRLGIKILHRSDIVKAFLDEYVGIAVAGAHGKTTTTSMLGQIFEEAILDPTIIIGGEVNYLNGNSKLGKGQYAIVEADESDGSFLKLRPNYVIVTNIENDHMDYYGTLENLKEAFKRFLENLPEQNSFAVVCGDNEHIQQITNNIDKRILTYGFSEVNEYQAKNIRYEKGRLVYDVFHHDDFEATVSLQVPGLHNVLNSLAVYVLARQLGIEKEIVLRALSKFIGAKRRFETKGHIDGVWIVDDYAHHPTEIDATLTAGKHLGTHRVVCVFQPHRYSRTEFLLKEFAKAFTMADVIVMTDIYSAGESPLPNIDGMSIPNAIKEVTGQEVLYVHNSDDLPEFLADFVQPNDLVITMGAGNITQYGNQLLALLENRSCKNEK